MRIDGFRSLTQQPRARRAGRARPDAEDSGPVLIEATALVPSEAEFERMARSPASLRTLSPLATPGSHVLEALSSYSRIAALLDDVPVRHYIDLYA
ncbi:MAG TPA: hypothetical protein VL178_03180 [Pseudomonas sp.]|jgi:hypothetical protein|nr:hypothetical protein [Pseudomonas sp.]